MGITDMMRQYLDIKSQHEDHILFFRLGDFYEMFFDDAIVASKELELTLTGRDYGNKTRAPMCGVPHHSSEGYIAKLIEKGYKVAVAEQMEKPQKGKNIVRREVVRVITPGTIIESSMLDEGSNNYICSLFINKNAVGMAFCDVSTGDFLAMEFSNGKNVDIEIINELSRYMPKEVLVNKEISSANVVATFMKRQMPVLLEQLPDDEFSFKKSLEILENHFSKKYINSHDIKDKKNAIIASGVLLSYVKGMQKIGTERISKIKIQHNNSFMNINLMTRENLELVKTYRTDEDRGSLLFTLDKTKTAMGKRMFKQNLLQPLLSKNAIDRRLNGVNELYNNVVSLSNTRESLSNVYDLQRLLTRVIYGNTTPRELNSLAYTFNMFPEIKEYLGTFNSEILVDINGRIDLLDDVKNFISTAIDDNPSGTIKEGNIIKEGYHSGVDELRTIVNDTKFYLSKIETSEREKTNIKTLKIGYNRIFGYYIEITNSYKDKVPKEYIRKQTLTNAERYITEELKEIENKILSASEKLMELEERLFHDIHKEVAKNLNRIQSTSEAIAELDILCSFAQVSITNKYTRPEIDNSGEIEIIDGRHPVVEKMLYDEMFVQNDTYIDNNDEQIMLITGPNMAGKSTYMRQTALIIIMAQIGCFVPASKARIGIVDNIFTRIGASDDLSSGKSTFMVEMSEMAHILSYATKDSFLILDEIGRGTSTYDGMSIAQAIIEYIASTLRAKTMFATHYHELTNLSNNIKTLKNYNIAVKKQDEDIIFLRRIVKGPVDESYGIEVSRLAGIPDYIVNRAKEILEKMEKGHNHLGKENIKDINKLSKKENSTINIKTMEIIKNLENIDIETISPLEALNILNKLKINIDENR